MEIFLSLKKKCKDLTLKLPFPTSCILEVQEMYLGCFFCRHSALLNEKIHFLHATDVLELTKGYKNWAEGTHRNEKCVRGENGLGVIVDCKLKMSEQFNTAALKG